MSDKSRSDKLARKLFDEYGNDHAAMYVHMFHHACDLERELGRITNMLHEEREMIAKWMQRYKAAKGVLPESLV